MRPSGDNGTIPDDWRMVRLGDVAEVRSGVGFPLVRQGRLYGAYPFIKVSDMTLDGNEVYIRNANNYVDIEDVGELGATILTPGTIVFPKVGAAIATNKKRVLLVPTVIDNNMAGVTVTDLSECDAVFLSHWFKSIDLFQFVNVSAVPSITSSRLKRASILLPPLAEQRRIAAVLDAIDDAIERTNDVIVATERLRDALLHDLLSHGVPGWHSEWRDVPGLGTIPADWEVVRLGEVAEVAFSSVDKKVIDGEVHVELCNYTDVFYNRRIRSGMGFMTATASPIECTRWSLRGGDVLFTKDSETPEEIGIPAYVAEDMPEVLCGYHLGRARPHADLIEGAYLAELLGSRTMSRQLSRIANGVTRFGLTLDATNGLYTALPPIQEQRLIAAMLNGVDSAIDRAQDERDGLQALKASAADALLSGRVRVDTEQGPGM